MTWIMANLLAPFMMAINHALAVAAMTLNLLMGGVAPHGAQMPVVHLSVGAAQAGEGHRTLALVVSVNAGPDSVADVSNHCTLKG